jgi:hypothetical protein
MTEINKQTAPTLPPEACPADRELTAKCRAAVRDRKNREALRALAEKQIQLWIKEGCWS